MLFIRQSMPPNPSIHLILASIHLSVQVLSIGSILKDTFHRHVLKICCTSLTQLLSLPKFRSLAPKNENSAMVCTLQYKAQALTVKPYVSRY